MKTWKASSALILSFLAAGFIISGSAASASLSAYDKD